MNEWDSRSLAKTGHYVVPVFRNGKIIVTSEKKTNGNSALLAAVDSFIIRNIFYFFNICMSGLQFVNSNLQKIFKIRL